MPDQDPSIETLTARLLDFRDARDWRQFHSLKELILSLNLEASEMLELTQWKTADQFDQASQTDDMQRKLQEECADVFIYALLIAERAGFDILEAAARKIDKNEAKYPVSKSRGRPTKYTDL